MRPTRNILAINFNHDGAGVILSEGRLAAYVSTERFSRLKKHPGLRGVDLENLLHQAGLKLRDIDLVIVLNYHTMDSPEIPEKYGTTLQETWLRFTLSEDRKRIRVFGAGQRSGHDIDCITNPDHYLAHAAAPYYFSPFDSAISFAYDVLGSGAYVGAANRLERIDFPESLVGLVYSIATGRLGFSPVFGAGKTMGLAPYGELADASLETTLALMVSRGIRRLRLDDVCGFISKYAADKPKIVKGEGGEWNATAAYCVQRLLELALSDILAGLHQRAVELKVEPNLCLSGGTALNSVANQRCFGASRFRRLYLHPACGDDGTAIGAALHYWHHTLGNPKLKRTRREAMYSVRSYDAEIEPALEEFKGELVVRKTADYIKEAARLVAAGKIIGWFQGASEIGPRALGNRSIVCDARRADMKRKLNSRVKFREMFRPFAPSVLNEHSVEWFGLKDSPFMLRVADVLRTGVPAITHVDGTARMQTVAERDNPAYYRLIEEFYRLTGVPMVLNTSFNIKGEPIVETPVDAIRSFLDSGMHHVVFKGYVLSKKRKRPGRRRNEVNG
jgi:carbamoyltransferase